ARAGRSVVVLERRPLVGGACTSEHPFAEPGWTLSPCAYVVGLLHPLVVEELGLARFGYRVHMVEPHLWCPFEDGRSLAIWDDRGRTAAAIAALSPADVDGYFAYEALFARIRRALRDPVHDTWVGDSPDRAELEALLGHDRQAVEVLFDTPIADVLSTHLSDERLHTALHGQGVIGTYAGPREPGTAAIHALHSLGTLEGQGGAWGYVVGGMGTISEALAGSARGAGATIVTSATVTAVVPGEGVVLDEGRLVPAATVVSNADPKRTLALCQGDVPLDFHRRVEGWMTDSPVVKVNCGLSRLPRFAADVGGFGPHRAMVTISTGVDATQRACDASRRGEPAPEWCELYFHSVYDPSVAPPGRHTMSVFAQYAPYRLAEGDWASRREEIGDRVLATIARFAPEVVDVVEHRQVLGPPDIEARTGLTGGHIFQGECLPAQMWDRRFRPRTPVAGLYLCGAATHPGGSVIGVNGRNAAMAVIADTADR
ncbi:MAG: NAD(P)/FAD-dependent oxidoreductase, partial [Actinomycetota bacterium]|nr:NAD(P)/FAD-dependent oxidoreductase [Actinomycetota bacterium]